MFTHANLFFLGHQLCHLNENYGCTHASNMKYILTFSD